MVFKGVALIKYFILLGFMVVAGCQSSHRPFDPAYRAGRYSGNRASYPAQTVLRVLQEVNESFTYRGSPIHPELVKEFECWISDMNPVTMAVDVSAAFDSNEYSSKPYIDGEWVRVKTDEGTYSYKWISSKDGVHILQTSDYSGGSQSFGFEIWVRFEICQSQYPDGEVYDQLIMQLVRVK